MRRTLGLGPASILCSTALLTACGDDGTSAEGTDPSATSQPSSPTQTTSGTPDGTTSQEPTEGGMSASVNSTIDTTSPTSPTSTTATTDTTGDVSASATDSSTSTPGTNSDPGTTSTSTTDPDPDTGDDTTGAASTGEPPCEQGTIVCEGDTKKVCDGMGGFTDEEVCDGFCLPDVGCVACEPNSYNCDGDSVQQCDAMGSGYDVIETCDPVQGQACDANVGACNGACAAISLGTSYIGCDYYPTVTAGLQETNPWVFHYAVVVANTTDQATNITITKGGMPVTNGMVGPNTAQVFQLPYVPALGIQSINTQGPTVMVADGAYRLRSDSPVTVYQYQPLEYRIGNSYSYINDAGLLLPVNTWGADFRVASRNHWTFNNFQVPGFYAVTAKEDNTTVTLTPSATGNKVFAGAGVAADGNGVVVLNEGDVLEVFTQPKGGGPDASDLTGTRVQSDKPVQVIGGHKCTNIPYNVQFCDRIEESIPPIDVLSKEYIVTAPLINNVNTKKNEMVRIIATEANTALTYEPPQNGAPALLANAGDYAEIALTQADFRITGDKKIMVAQYFLGQNGGGNSGDPAMTIAVTTEQFRDEYLVHAPTNYDTSFANIVAPPNANVTVDGAPVAGFTPIGATGFSVARIALSNAGDGNHLFAGDQKFGVMIYGYGQYTSYWYPGGLDLKFIPQ